ncbi:MAG TPA: hypothetical protein VGK67_30160 [Myxococcales bacterium]|jgi:tetratricopeptide (TPR) repeat protein
MKPALWKAVVPGVAVVGLIFGGVAWWNRTHATVHVLDGLGSPVTVTFGELPPLTVNSGGRATLEVPTGPVKVVVRLGEKVLSTEEVVIPKGRDFVAYNVLGAAPLFQLRAHYTSNPNKDAKPDIEVLAGKTLSSVELVDSLFTDLPQSITTNSQYGETIRVQVQVAGNGGWETGAGMLLTFKKNAEAAQTLRQVIRVEDGAVDLTLAAIERAEGRPAAIAFAKDLVRERPDFYSAHRVLQWLLRETDGIETARAFYRARAAEHPDSPFEQLLLARVDENAAAEAALRRLLSAVPDDERVLRYLAVVVARSQRWKEAAELLDRAPKNAGARSYQDLHVVALAGAGRAKEALELLEQSLEQNPTEEELLLAVSTAQSLGDTDRAKALADKYEKKLEVDVVRALAGLPAKGAESLAAKVVRAAEKGPAEAWDAIPKGQESSLNALGDQMLLLLATEFHRMGDPSRAEVLYAAVEQRVPSATIYAYVERGEEGADVLASESRFRAPLYLARALAVEASGGNGAKLREQAARADVPAGFVAWAASAWAKGVRPAPRSDEDNPITFVRTRIAGR